MSDILPLSVYLDTYSNETSAEVGKIVQMARTLESRIAELEGENHRMKVVLNTVHGQDQEISRLRDEKIALEAQTERDRARIAELEAAARALDKMLAAYPNYRTGRCRLCMEKLTEHDPDCPVPDALAALDGLKGNGHE